MIHAASWSSARAASLSLSRLRLPMQADEPGGLKMKREQLTEKLLDIKREKGWTWKYICEQIGGMAPVMITGGVLGQQKMTKPMAAAAAKLFGLSKTEEALLNEVPMRGTG